MSQSQAELVARADIARLAGVRRPAVSNWERRHTDFPAPVASREGDEAELFRISDVLDWLKSRRIPSNAREPGEPKGFTYAARFLRNLGTHAAAQPSDAAQLTRERDQIHQALDQLMGPMTNRFSHHAPAREYLELLLGLVFLRGSQPDAWAQAVGTSADPPTFSSWVDAALDASTPGWSPRQRWAQPVRDLTAIVHVIDGLPPGSAAAALAFELIIGRFPDVAEHRAAEFFTPASIARTIAEIVADGRHAERVLDPFCRAGELLSAVAHRLTADGSATSAPTVRGGSPDAQSLRIAHMNLTLHGTKNELYQDSAEPWYDMPHERADIVVANPPFNMRGSWPDPIWRYGEPRPNANFAWLQYMIASLRPGGRAVAVMANSAGVVSQSRGIRKRMIEDGAVECLVALPSQLFPSTGIPVTLWILRHPTGACDGVLFVDATRLGAMASRTQRVLTDDDITKIVNAFRGRQTTDESGTEGLARLVGLAEIRDHDYALNSSLYAGPRSVSTAKADTAALAELTAELSRLHARATEAGMAVDRLMKEIG